MGWFRKEKSQQYSLFDRTDFAPKLFELFRSYSIICFKSNVMLFPSCLLCAIWTPLRWTIHFSFFFVILMMINPTLMRMANGANKICIFNILNYMIRKLKEILDWIEQTRIEDCFIPFPRDVYRRFGHI